MSNVSIARIPHTGGNRKYTTWLFKKQKRFVWPWASVTAEGDRKVGMY